VSIAKDPTRKMTTEYRWGSLAGPLTDPLAKKTDGA